MHSGKKSQHHDEGTPNVTDLELFDLLADEIMPTVDQIEVAGR